MLNEWCFQDSDHVTVCEPTVNATLKRFVPSPASHQVACGRWV